MQPLRFDWYEIKSFFFFYDDDDDKLLKFRLKFDAHICTGVLRRNFVLKYRRHKEWAALVVCQLKQAALQ